MTAAGFVKHFIFWIRRLGSALRASVTWAWKAALAVLTFLNLIEDDVQPPRLSSTKVMVWGAMGVGAYLIGRLQFTGEPINLTEAGVISVLTVAAGLMKFNRDRQDQRGGRGRWADPNPCEDEADPFANET